MAALQAPLQAGQPAPVVVPIDVPPTYGRSKAAFSTAPFLMPTQRLTCRQIVWLFVMQGIGSMIIDAAINFGIHVALYDNTDPIHLFPFPNTIAGDLAVTLIVQNILTWIIGGMLQWQDVWDRRVNPLAQPRRPKWLSRAINRIRLYVWLRAKKDTGVTVQPSAGPIPPVNSISFQRVGPLGRLMTWWIATPDLCHSRRRVVLMKEPQAAGAGQGVTQVEAKEAPGTIRPGADAAEGSYLVDSEEFVISQRGVKKGSIVRDLIGLVLRGLLYSIPTFCIFWPITVGILAGIWGGDDYNHFPQTPLIFAVYGGVLGLVTGPILGATVLWTAGRGSTMNEQVAPVRPAAPAAAPVAAPVAVPAVQ